MSIRSERKSINLTDVKSGMMVQFDYVKQSGETGQYVVLVVDPNRKNARATQPQLHGFIIDQLTDEQLLEFFSSFRKNIKIDYEDRRASIIEGLNSEEAYETFKASNYVKDRTYRTFNLNSISNLRQILLGSVK